MKTVKEQVNIEPKKANKKRWIWLSLSIGIISIAVIVTIVVSLNLKNNNTIPTLTLNYDGVYYNNYNSSSTVYPMVCYSIDIEKDNYDYNEEFIIKYTIVDIGGYMVLDRNNLNFKIVSDEFEFLSPTEYHFDLDTDVSTYGNILSFGERSNDLIYPIELELKVKAKEPSENIDTINIDSILFSFEFSLVEDYKEILLDYDKGETFRENLNEFTKDFKWIHRFYFLDDELGTLLVDMNKRFEYYDTIYKTMSYINSYTEIRYRSLNRLYEKELITKQEYMKRLINHFTNKRPSIYCLVKKDIQDGYIISFYSYEYYSRNVRASLKDERNSLYGLYLKEEGKIQVAKILLQTLYEQGKITLEEYNNEIAILDEDGILTSVDWQEFISSDWMHFFDQFNAILVPFEDYKDYYLDINIEI